VLTIRLAVKSLVVSMRVAGHDDLLKRGVAGALTDAVDGAFDLSCPMFDSRK
jgi:hypothetical protein